MSLASDLQVEPEEIPLFSQPTEVSFFSATWVHDRRDNAADPTRGSSTQRISISPARAIGSSAGFIRGTVAEFDLHAHRIAAGFRAFDAFRLHRARRTNHCGGHSSARAVLRRRRNDTARLWLEPGRPARSADRISHRRPGGCWSSISSCSFPCGCPGSAIALSGAVFYDAGNVFSSVGQITLRSAPAHARLYSPDSRTYA